MLTEVYFLLTKRVQGSGWVWGDGGRRGGGGRGEGGGWGGAKVVCNASGGTLGRSGRALGKFWEGIYKKLPINRHCDRYVDLLIYYMVDSVIN